MSNQCMECRKEEGKHESWCGTSTVEEEEKRIIKEARKQAFLEAAEMVDLLLTGTIGVGCDMKFAYKGCIAKLLREKAQE